MANPSSSPPPPPPPTPPRRTTTFNPLLLLLALLLPILVSFLVFKFDSFDAAPMPADYSTATVAVPATNDKLLSACERIGEGLLPGPEDLAFDARTGMIYTGCYDGWIKRVRLGESPAVEDWAFVGGRPLGVAFAPDGSLVVAEADKGLLVVREDRTVELLTDSAEGLRFRLTDGVDVASDGTIYFTDASYKYSLAEHMLDHMENRPYGRLLSYHPDTNRTIVLARELYFANGVAVAPDQRSLVFCESILRRCKRYHIRGEKKGTIDMFIDNIPGIPDNVRYDGENHYWIGLAWGRTFGWDTLLKYPFLRKLRVALGKYIRIPNVWKNGGVLSVSLEGEPVSLYWDPGLYHVTCGLKIGNYLYQGSLTKSYINHIDLTRHAAKAN